MGSWVKFHIWNHQSVSITGHFSHILRNSGLTGSKSCGTHASCSSKSWNRRLEPWVESKNPPLGPRLFVNSWNQWWEKKTMKPPKIHIVYHIRHLLLSQSPQIWGHKTPGKTPERSSPPCRTNARSPPWRAGYPPQCLANANWLRCLSGSKIKLWFSWSVPFRYRSFRSIHRPAFPARDSVGLRPGDVVVIWMVKPCQS